MRGLILDEIRRGPLFGDRNGAAQRYINLALNVPPSTGEDELIASVPSRTLADDALPPVCGLASHRKIMAERLVGWRRWGPSPSSYAARLIW